MAYKVQASFASGELDPALHERTTLQKYDSGLKTARNTIIGKTGRVLSRQGRKYLLATKLASRTVRIYGIPGTSIFIEFGHLYVRAYNVDTGTLIGEDTHSYTEAYLESCHFDSTIQKQFNYLTGDTDTTYVVFVFCDTKNMLAIGIQTPSTVDVKEAADVFSTGASAPTPISNTVSGTGYDVEYYVTSVIDNIEFHNGSTTSTSAPKLPISSGEKNTIVVDCGPYGVNFTELRVYRRPKQAGAYGYIGSTSYKVNSAGLARFTFDDVGQEADYTHVPPTLTDTMRQYGFGGPEDFFPTTGIVYQQRLLFAQDSNIEASRIGAMWDFHRDYPLNSSCAQSLQVASTGATRVLRMVESDGLVAFSTVGVHFLRGGLSPTNLALQKRGSWVIDERVPPLGIPGGVLFVDKATNTVRNLTWSEEAGSFKASELSIFSNHLFQGNRIVSWAFHDGETPLLYVVFDDGTFASFTYEQDQEMRAWTRHDSEYLIEYVASSGVKGKTLFVINKNGTRYVEVTVPRYVSASDLSDNPEADKGVEIAYMDGIVSYSSLLNDSLVGADVFTILPIAPGEWDGILEISHTSSLFVDPGSGTVGTIYRVFDEDGSSIDLEIVSRTSNNIVRVQPSCEFPQTLSLTARLYKTATTVSGLSHLEDEEVSVIVDGYVVASPNNDIENYPTVTVSGGSITLPSDLRGAIIHVGRPITGDVETLDIDTVEQRPTFIESKTVNKVYVKTHKSRGLYIGNKFPDDDKVNRMFDIDTMDVDYEDDDEIIGNRYDPPKTKRIEATIPGDWRSNGRVCLRQVDPLHFEILSIIPDLEDQRR